MTKQLLIAFAMMTSLCTFASGQSTDPANPTRVTGGVLTGTARGSGTYVYSLKSKRGTTVTVRTDLTVRGDGSQAFSLDFRGMEGVSGGQTECCRGETYMPFADNPAMRTSFRMLTDERFLMFLNFDATENPLPYRITFEGLNFDDDATGDADTIIVPGNSGTRWIDTGIDVQRGDVVSLSPTGTVDVSSSWGTHDAKGSTRYARVPGYPVNSPRRYGLAAKIGSQRWAYTGASVTALRAGRLFLTCNDDSPSDNDGKFVVNVQLTRR